MVERSILIFCFLVIPLFPAAAQPGFSLGARGHGGLVLTRAEGWALQPQADGSLGVQAEYRFELDGVSGLSVGAGLGWHHTFPSPYFDHGVQYRGSTGLEGRLSLGWDAELPPLAGAPPARVGVQAEALARFDRFVWSELYFFYPGLAIGPYLEIGPGPASRFRYRVLMPLELYLRRDLTASSSAGLAFVLLYQPGGDAR